MSSCNFVARVQERRLTENKVSDFLLWFFPLWNKIIGAAYKQNYNTRSKWFISAASCTSSSMKSSGLAWCLSAFCCRDDTKVDGAQPGDTTTRDHRIRRQYTDMSHLNSSDTRFKRQSGTQHKGFLSHQLMFICQQMNIRIHLLNTFID